MGRIELKGSRESWEKFWAQQAAPADTPAPSAPAPATPAPAVTAGRTGTQASAEAKRRQAEVKENPASASQADSSFRVVPDYLPDEAVLEPADTAESAPVLGAWHRPSPIMAQQAGAQTPSQMDLSKAGSAATGAAIDALRGPVAQGAEPLQRYTRAFADEILNRLRPRPMAPEEAELVRQRTLSQILERGD